MRYATLRSAEEVDRRLIEDKVRPVVLAAVETKGYQGVTYEGVAAASGVAKTTLYRHWPTKAELVFDLVVHGQTLRGLDCDPTVESASQALAERVARFLGAGPAARAVPAVLLDMAGDPVLAERLRHGFVAEGRGEVEQLLERCGLEPVQGMDAGDIQMVLLGAAQSWLTVAGLSVDEVEDRLTVLASALLTAGS